MLYTEGILATSAYLHDIIHNQICKQIFFSLEVLILYKNITQARSSLYQQMP